MLIQATMQDVEKYGDFAWKLAQDPAKSAYPTYTDGIKTCADFFREARRSVEAADSQLLLFEQGGVVEGWVQFFWIVEEKYLQLTGCNIRRGTRQALGELLNLLRDRFPGYTLYFGFPGENEQAIGFLRENGFEYAEEDWNHSFFFEKYALRPEDGHVRQITRENFSDFQTIYHPDENTYWNCDRILERMEDWIILAYYQGDAPVGVLFLQGTGEYVEIFGSEYLNGVYRADVHRALLTAALNQCRRRSARYMTYFCEEEACDAVREAGFHRVGKYVCLVKTT